ncbi:RNA 2',3'-cyclic phosphodiesterase [Methylomonas sp. SURF-2]|uniref:RNA 2',3'-cyclic phosphodiesterase n=1 Tax=Methylomonas subterranea TaxID=2952225 RepID=A0ABT1TBD6_9GAMM|nr:RNA 2',3'-cyclic phosphodiesterase [Methylomonas sp. SURF-2]MCQ8102556.1 RNA 2',3'-cyclic phosphodiesterase [Methylomonas sp. SURF-2]
MKRLFFALWPDEETRRQCHRLSQALSHAGKPVAADNLHVTLVFLGNIDRAEQEALAQAAASLPVQAMELKFDRLCFWKKPAVLCLAAGQCPPPVSTLVAELSLRAERLGIGLDKRPYRPHVTLARKAKNLPDMTFEPIVWRARGFGLLESVATPAGVEYRLIERWGGVV